MMGHERTMCPHGALVSSCRCINGAKHTRVVACPWPEAHRDYAVTAGWSSDGLTPQFRQRDGDQPLPVPNEEQGIHDRLIEMLQKRKALGLSRYGSLLQPGNGRNAPLDVLEELLDGAAYAMQWQLEREALLAKVAELEKELRIVKQDRATLAEELNDVQSSICSGCQAVLGRRR